MTRPGRCIVASDYHQLQPVGAKPVGFLFAGKMNEAVLSFTAVRNHLRHAGRACARGGPPEQISITAVRCPVAIAVTPQYPSFRSSRSYFPIAQPGTVEYATATGNKFRRVNRASRSLAHFTLVGILYLVTVLSGLATSSMMGHSPIWPRPSSE